MPKEDIILHLLCRLFWLVTQADGVARYASDVKKFTEVQVSLGITTRKEADRLIESYEKGEKK